MMPIAFDALSSMNSLVAAKNLLVRVGTLDSEFSHSTLLICPRVKILCKDLLP
jgi:hypothetical protein